MTYTQTVPKGNNEKSNQMQTVQDLQAANTFIASSHVTKPGMHLTLTPDLSYLVLYLILKLKTAAQHHLFINCSDLA